MSLKVLACVGEIAAEQYGCFSRAQIQEAGISNAQLRGLLRSGSVERVTYKVFRMAGSTRSWLQAVMIACLDGGPDCHASHRTAAALHTLDGFRHGGIIEVVVPMEVRHRRPDVIVHHTRSLPDEDRTHVGPIPVTSVARTLIDLGAVLPATEVETALDGAERDKRMARTTLARRYSSLRKPGRNGIGAMTQILEEREGLERVPRSVLERRMKRLLERAGLPDPTCRFVIRIGDRTFEIDFAYADLRFGIEVDGHGSHATRAARAADTERQNLIENAGWMIRRFTYEQVVYDEQHVIDVVRDALALARDRL
jgi:very-short-patch-repair endonuclease